MRIPFRVLGVTTLAMASLMPGEMFSGNSANTPELSQLARMVGFWETTARCQFLPGAPIFEGKSRETVYWSRSHQFLISDKRGTTPTGELNQLQIIFWDPVKKQFQITELTPGGSLTEMTMNIEGNSARVVGTHKEGDHVVQIWLTSEYVSSTESHFRSECSLDGSPKWLFSEGVSKKIASTSD